MSTVNSYKIVVKGAPKNKKGALNQPPIVKQD